MGLHILLEGLLRHFVTNSRQQVFHPAGQLFELLLLLVGQALIILCRVAQEAVQGLELFIAEYPPLVYEAGTNIDRGVVPFDGSPA